MTKRDHVVWAGALEVEKRYGIRGFAFIDGQIDELSGRDLGGIEMWCKIGEALDQLNTPGKILH